MFLETGLAGRSIGLSPANSTAVGGTEKAARPLKWIRRDAGQQSLDSKIRTATVCPYRFKLKA